MTAADSSREAYAKHWKRLDTLRYKVYEEICRQPGLDDLSYANILHLEINSVTGRIHELKEAGLINTVTASNVKGNTARRSYPAVV